MTMDKTGLARPGAMQMVLAVVLAMVISIGPLFMAATRPDHQWSVAWTGLPAFGVAISGIVAGFVYFVGFLRYAVDKGYSPWLAFWLFCGNAPGFIALILLPDRRKGEATNYFKPEKQQATPEKV
ncbi:MAG: hypothetical protein KGS72_13135 [Cyanobacteria bacterium REEB67]|nr:hypothetical protein [Cyanobacteria bacterium REEB67]